MKKANDYENRQLLYPRIKWHVISAKVKKEKEFNGAVKTTRSQYASKESKSGRSVLRGTRALFKN